MSKLIASAAIRASHTLFKRAEEMLEKVTADKGKDFVVELPDTAFYLPQIYAMTAFKVQTLTDMKVALEMTREMLQDMPDEKLWKPYLGEALDSGMATLFLEEIILAIKHINGEEPATDPETGYVYNGFITDTIQRNLGIQLVDGRMPGFACIIGAAPDDETAEKIVRELQEKNILTFLSGTAKDKDGKETNVTQQLLRRGVELGWDTYIVPLGPDVEHTVYAASWSIRASMIFGGNKPGDYKAHLKYTKDRVFAFAMVLGELTDIIWSTGANSTRADYFFIYDLNEHQNFSYYPNQPYLCMGNFSLQE